VQAETWRTLTGSEPEVRLPETARLELLKRCKRCDYQNPRDSIFCNRCAFALSDKIAAEKAVAAVIGPTESSDFTAKVNRLAEALAKSPEVLDTVLSALSIVSGERKEKAIA